MKKSVIMLAIIFMAAATTASAVSDKKEKKQAKKEKTEVVAEPVQLISQSDSLSYASGVNSTRGLMDYLIKSLKIDTAYIDDFIAGYRESMTRQADPKYKAFTAGTQIASQVETQFLPHIMQQFEGTDVTVNPILLHEGFIAGVKADTTLMAEATADKYVQNVTKQKKEIRNSANKTAGEKFLAENKLKPGVVTTESGLQYKVLTEGTGAKPTANDVVTVRYEGRLLDGTVFDSSYKRNPDTTSFKVSNLIKGWVEALQLMPVGSKWELYIPYDLAYGEREAGQITPYSTLIFTMELVSIQEPTPAKK